MSENERLKYLFKSVLGVDVDAIVHKVVAAEAVERARRVRKNSTEWEQYMKSEGGVVVLPRQVTHVGRR